MPKSAKVGPHVLLMVLIDVVEHFMYQNCCVKKSRKHKIQNFPGFYGAFRSHLHYSVASKNSTVF